MLWHKALLREIRDNDYDYRVVGGFCVFVLFFWTGHSPVALFRSVTGLFWCAGHERVQVPSRVVTAKCSEPQADVSNDSGGGSGVEKPASLRTETGYKAKWRVRVPNNLKPKR